MGEHMECEGSSPSQMFARQAPYSTALSPQHPPLWFEVLGIFLLLLSLNFISLLFLCFHFLLFQGLVSFSQFPVLVSNQGFQTCVVWVAISKVAFLGLQQKYLGLWASICYTMKQSLVQKCVNCVGVHSQWTQNVKLHQIVGTWILYKRT